jgi:transposase InsO family protein
MHVVHRSWIYELLARYRAGGYEALAPRSRRPRTCPHQTSEVIEQAIVELRHKLSSDGHDAGAHTIAHHLRQRFDEVPSVTTIWRVLKRSGLVEIQPQKRPKSSLIRFEADLPNQMWQADFTHWRLADGTEVEILNFIDDHSRLFLASDVYPTTTAQAVVASFQKACDYHGLPASLLTDNGAVFTGYYRGGKVLLESELERLGIVFKNSRPYHPQTCGKVERLHQTLKRYLAKQTPAKDLDELRGQLDRFRDYYNNIRPHRALSGRTPLQAFETRVKAKPAEPIEKPHFRVRKDKVDQTGRVTLRHDSRLHHIALGRAHKGRRVTILVADLDVRVIDDQGELIRQLRLDPSRNYQPLEST